MTKIAMMTAWNTDSGVAIHAEPIGKAWIQMGWQVFHPTVRVNNSVKTGSKKARLLSNNTDIDFLERKCI